MKENLVNRTFQTIIEAFQNCLKRFPVTVGFVCVLTLYALYLVHISMDGDKQLLLAFGYYLSIGSLLSLTLHLWSEEVKSKTQKTIVCVVAHMLLIADAAYLYTLSPNQWHIEIAIAHVAGILALGISVFFLSFIKEKNDIPSWNFAAEAGSSFTTAFTIGFIMCGGICLLLLSLHMLFNVYISTKWYLYCFILCTVLLPALLFLGLLPQGENKHKPEPVSSGFQTGTIRFLFLPLITAYLVVLYAYAARILISWELPNGWVSWLIVALMSGCIAIEFGLYATRIKEAKRTDELIARWLPALILPLLMLMTVGIIRRFNDYGVTINRLYLITLNAWFYLVCIGLCLNRARRISWIPVSFAVLFLLTSVLPINYASITRSTIRNDIRKEMKNAAGLNLPLSAEEYNKWLASLPQKTAARVNDKLMYLKNWFGAESTNDLVAPDTSLRANQLRYNEDTGTQNTDSISSVVTYNGQINQGTSIEIPAGYSRLVAIPDNIRNNMRQMPEQSVKTGVLPVYLGLQTDGKNDTAYIDIKTLQMINESAGRLPVRFKCNSQKCLFVLTRFSLNYQEPEDKDIRLSIDGYVFKK